MNEKGFTIAEVIIAMALVGILAVGFIPIITAQYVNIHKTGDKSIATYDAMEDTEKKMEDIKKDIESGTAPAPDGKVDIELPNGNKIETEVNKVNGTGIYKNEKIEIDSAVPVKTVGSGDSE